MHSDVMPGELAFINDGYSRPILIEAVLGMYPEVEYIDRPMTIEQRAEFLSKYRALPDGPKRERLQANFLNHHILEWNLKLKPGKDADPLPKSVASILTLVPSLFTRMADITLWGHEPGDLPSRLASADKQNRILAEAEAAIEGTPYADKDLELATKN